MESLAVMECNMNPDDTEGGQGRFWPIKRCHVALWLDLIVFNENNACLEILRKRLVSDFD